MIYETSFSAFNGAGTGGCPSFSRSPSFSSFSLVLRSRLHFLPPHCPSFNPIERVWLDLHAEVTRNHRCRTIDELMIEVKYYLKHRNRETLRDQKRAVA